jgi:ABC-type sugar transport system ATPase subunit
MGRAIVRNPTVFLMDEPLSNLDAELRNQMRIEIKSLQRRLRTTTVYVTHDQIEAMTLADRIAVMNDGEIQQFGTPSELYERPNNKFVAGFIGSPRMNFMQAKKSDNGWLVLANGCQMHISSVLRNVVANFAKIEIGVRPENIRIVSDPAEVDPAESVGWWASVRLCEELGSETIVHFDSPADALQVKIGREIRISEGEKIGLTFDINAAHLFCGDTGVCIGYAPER